MTKSLKKCKLMKKIRYNSKDNSLETNLIDN